MRFKRHMWASGSSVCVQIAYTLRQEVFLVINIGFFEGEASLENSSLQSCVHAFTNLTVL